MSACDEVLLDAIVRWVRHSREKQLPMFDKFVKIPRLSGLFNYMNYIVKKLIENLDTALMQNVTQPVNFCAAYSDDDKSLYVYMKDIHTELVSVFSISIAIF